MTLSEKTYRVGGRDLFVAEAGDGPAVLLLHGGGPGASGMSNYVRNIEPLSAHYRVIVPDLPGYGRSSKSLDHSDPFGDLATAVRGLLDELGLRSAHLVGNSYGGSAALRLALETPDRVGRLVLMGPGGVGTTRSLPTPGLQKLLNYYRGDGPSKAKLEEFIRTYLVFDGGTVPEEAIEQRYQASIDPEVVADPPLRRPSSLKTLWRMDFTRDPRLSQLRTPTLAIWGARDKVNRPAGGHTLARTMPNCDLLLVANTGHWVQWERAEGFNATLRTFLGTTA
ncbi:alpha/beta fold hydrolase [Amycolatopsis acidicola]|uniref:Alpha/beta fold hydrolase n=1 Tax=Amycolatopsis acidicola TaxID=2596893 RepID=A0A5N0V4P2_9PSEU|nr:alpha/beta fold hydrolase [Amycolatopsis acidicola]KAA9160764.1 alpha/beta fold hydrolase [Amycolatopsis acidicola]